MTGSAAQRQAEAPYLGLLLLGGVHDGGAAHLCLLPTLPVEGPAADLVSDDVLDEEHAAVEAQGELVEQLDVFQQVVIGVAEKPVRAHRPGSEVPAQGWCRLGSPLPCPPLPHRAHKMRESQDIRGMVRKGHGVPCESGGLRGEGGELDLNYKTELRECFLSVGPEGRRRTAGSTGPPVKPAVSLPLLQG